MQVRQASGWTPVLFSWSNVYCVFVIVELTSGNAEGSLKKAEDVMKIVQGWSEKEVPNKKEVLGSLHSCIGNAFIDLGDLGKALDHHQKDLEFAKQWWEFEENYTIGMNVLYNNSSNVQ